MRPGRLVLSVGVAAWSSSAGSAGAQRVTPDTIPLSLPDAIRRATTESEEIRITGAQLRTAETAVTSTCSRLFPQIGADLAYVRTLENPHSAGIDVFRQLPLGRDRVYSVTVNASQVIFAGRGVRAGIRLARRERETGRAGELAGTLEGGDAP
jgi:outer membrane protein TolC